MILSRQSTKHGSKVKERKHERVNLFLAVTTGASSVPVSSPPMRHHPRTGRERVLRKFTIIVTFLLQVYMCLRSMRYQERNAVSVRLLRKIPRYFLSETSLKYYIGKIKVGQFH